ncbi:hypothetical protein [Fibrella forsythiae]|uniref:Immunity protein 63 domain-containing protein n=1 Tax=Fibrella forsythiae TaxID=2817061 RepID=A0ABS3JKS8_9BACT|nr:hypothetical protein [Fibrella forsythiae]MBO0950617.1 hypothetical protein [Fibrella forsythiae]
MMEIILEPNSLRLSSSGNIHGVLYFETSDKIFPDTDWNDFVVVLLGWWVESAINLKQGLSKQERLRFMDGPYSILVKYIDKNQLSLDFIEKDHTIDSSFIQLSSFINILSKACEKLLKIIEANNWQTGDISLLKSRYASLQRESLSKDAD